MKMQIHSLPLGAGFGAGKIEKNKHCFIRYYRPDGTKKRPIIAD